MPGISLPSHEKLPEFRNSQTGKQPGNPVSEPVGHLRLSEGLGERLCVPLRICVVLVPGQRMLDHRTQGDWGPMWEGKRTMDGSSKSGEPAIRTP
jgi:hypothetical protein